MTDQTPIHVSTMHGQMAGIIHNTGPVYFYSPGRLDSYPTLRDIMPPSCHAELAWAMQDAHISANDLTTACRRNALRCIEGRLQRPSPWLHYLVGWGATAVCIVLLLGLFASILRTPTSTPASGQLWILATVIAAAAMWMQSLFIWPQLTARKAMRSVKRLGNGA